MTWLSVKLRGRILFCIAGATAAIYLPFVLFLSADLGRIFFVVATALLSLPLLVVIVVNRLPGLWVFAMFWGLSAVFVMNHWAIRDHARWFVWASTYKATVLAQPRDESGKLRHTLWDGWGWLGGHTEAFVVYDPEGSLAAAATTMEPGTPVGLPCAVAGIRRLEKHWYAVSFFTDTSWDHCTAR